jgi:hypothetical protein
VAVFMPLPSMAAMNATPLAQTVFPLRPDPARRRRPLLRSGVNIDDIAFRPG